MNDPILYSFRRCPYAMRARMAMRLAGLQYEHREILLRDKPQKMLEASPKGTVPVLITPSGTVVDESLDVMLWALAESQHPMLETVADSKPWVMENDTVFKPQLDRYKYPNRYPDEGDVEAVREQALTESKKFFEKLDDALTQNGGFILGDQSSLADIALFPFVRQFSKVDEDLWSKTASKKLKHWLGFFLESADFKCIMTKYSLWQEGQPPLMVGIE